MALLQRLDGLTKRWPFLDGWQFWVGVAYFGLAMVTVALWVSFARETRQAQARRADIIANADAQYTQCITSIPTLGRIDSFIDGVRGTNAVLLRNALASHAATPPGSELYRVQILNIARLRASVKSAEGVRFPIPTRAECSALRNRLITSR
jgi:hypothetical protein